jgi:hypothetical protein
MPVFRDVLSLVQHFVERQKQFEDGGGLKDSGKTHVHCVLIGAAGKGDKPLALRKPLEVVQNGTRRTIAM